MEYIKVSLFRFKNSRMDIRKFFSNGSLLAIGSSLLNPFDLSATQLDIDTLKRNKKAKNIIIVVSDGMSIGTLNMADLYLSRKTATATTMGTEADIP